MRKLFKITLIVWTVLGFHQSYAQKHLFSEVSINKRNAYIGEPVQVTISVYTSTWFTKGVDLQTPKIDGAFSVYFRSLSSSKTIKGKNYAGVQFFYNIFPYEDVQIEIPSLEITVETPDEDDYKGKKRTIRTRPRFVNVKSIPDGFDENTWLVSNNLTGYERWSRRTDRVKVGDVIERRITREAQGTIYEMLPQISWDSVPGISIYPGKTNFKNIKTSTAISAKRTDRYSYLFEKEGTVTIPEKVVLWWNPRQQRLYKKTLKARAIEVAPNPDLGMLSTLKDSLATVAQAQVETITEEKEKGYSVFGMPLRKFILLVIAGIIILMVLLRITVLTFRVFRKRRREYLLSEQYIFNQFLNALGKDNIRALELLYKWIDNIPVKDKTASDFIQTYGSAELQAMFERFEKDAQRHRKSGIMNKDEWRNARKNFIKGRKRADIQSNSRNWINP
ncbi:hypothetical protein FUAX_40490 (plasmid) [Fulvitalea axinellae]|uniref:Protein BatD n=1 Tax=Fulvitalea axinellae TaxID=1182444 RepID=A0AAU9D1T5_9BACT|nr:hypothetical protein FUAX_40490 [Fulvitalea axinellae]